MDEIKVFIKINSNNEIIDINSNIFLSDTTEYTNIDSGYGDKYAHAQGFYLEKGLMDSNGLYNYRFENNQIVEISESEKQEKIDAIEQQKQMTLEEVNELLIKAQINILEVDDSKALKMKSFYPTFDEIVDKVVEKGFKFTYEDKLYKTIQDNLTIQSIYPPSTVTESLYTEICESHSGSFSDPIPYNNNMELLNGKYYIQNGVTYKCTRDTGKPVYHNLSDLVGLYVEVVS